MSELAKVIYLVENLIEDLDRTSKEGIRRRLRQIKEKLRNELEE